MNDWTPTTEDVREDYRDARIMGDRDPDAEFERWLKQVQAEAWDEGYSASETTWKHIYDGHPAPEGEMCPECSTGNPYRQEPDV